MTKARLRGRQGAKSCAPSPRRTCCGRCPGAGAGTPPVLQRRRPRCRNGTYDDLLEHAAFWRGVRAAPDAAGILIAP